MGKVTVRVRRTSKPLILILSSYESVHWNIVSDSESKLAAVLISGYHPSEVIGAKGAKIITIGDKYAYSLESNQYHSLNKEAVKWTGKEIGLFQGKYEGNLFSVGN